VFGELSALGAAITWAIAPALYRKALFRATPAVANALRCLTNALFLLAILLLANGASSLSSLSLLTVTATVLSGVVGLGLGDLLYMTSLESIGLSKAVPIASSYPFFSFLWAILFLDEVVTIFAVAGALSVFAGILLLSWTKPKSGFCASQKRYAMGIASGFATALCWSVSVTLMDSAVAHAGMNSLSVNLALVASRVTAASCLMLPLLPVFHRQGTALRLNRFTVLQLFTGGILANGVGWLLMNFSLSLTAESVAVPISSVSPLFSTLLGAAVFHEKIDAKNSIGVLLVVFGLALLFA
jgi:DME family drug/metabolite transporter